MRKCHRGKRAAPDAGIRSMRSMIHNCTRQQVYYPEKLLLSRIDMKTINLICQAATVEDAEFA